MAEPASRWAPTPAGVVAQSEYPLPRVWEWTLADGVRVWFRRSAGEPGRLLVRGRASGGWNGLAGASPTSLADPGGLRLDLLADEAVMEGEGTANDPAGLARLVASVLSGRLPEPVQPSARVAMDAALAGGRLGGDASSSAVALRFGRPGAFHVLASGDVAPDAFIAAVAPVMGRLRAGAEVWATAADSSASAAAPARTLEIDEDGRGSRAIVAFRAMLDTSASGRRPDQTLAALQVLASLVSSSLESEGLDSDVTVDLDGERATLIITSDTDDPAGVAQSVMSSAARVTLSEATVARARGRASDRHERSIGSPAGWIEWLDFLSANAVDPRSIHHFGRTVRAVTVDRVRVLSRALLDPVRAGVVLVGAR